MNGWLLLRLLGISVGIITLLGFATDYMHVEFKPYFQTVLESLQGLVDTIIAAEQIEWMLDYLRSSVPWVPDPAKHWRPIFTLTALLLLSVARQMPWEVIPIAFFCTLIPAVYAGTVPMGSPAVSIWPVAGLGAFLGIVASLLGNVRDAQIFLAACGLNALLGCAVVVLGYTAPDDTTPFIGLASLVGITGVAAIVAGWSDANGTLWQRLTYPGTLFGLDVTGTFGGAITLAYLFAA
jgi:hypothetical protein